MEDKSAQNEINWNCAECANSSIVKVSGDFKTFFFWAMHSSVLPIEWRCNQEGSFYIVKFAWNVQSSSLEPSKTHLEFNSSIFAIKLTDLYEFNFNSHWAKTEWKLSQKWVKLSQKWAEKKAKNKSNWVIT